VPGDSDSESQGAIGLQTAKLSPISGNVTGATAQLLAPVQSGGLRHPYSDMSADDFRAEPTGDLGLTAVQTALVGYGHVVTPSFIKRPEKLFTSTISRPECHVTDQDEQFATGVSSNGKKARTEKLSRCLRCSYIDRCADSASNV